MKIEFDIKNAKTTATVPSTTQYLTIPFNNDFVSIPSCWTVPKPTEVWPVYMTFPWTPKNG